MLDGLCIDSSKNGINLGKTSAQDAIREPEIIVVYITLVCLFANGIEVFVELGLQLTVFVVTEVNLDVGRLSFDVTSLG